ncbi:MAG: hypothetical protein ACJ76F_08810 [Bacteroidia bacterium]
MCFLSAMMRAQENTKIAVSDPKSKADLCIQMENTYQVIVSNPRIKIALSSDACEIVKRERKRSETVFYKYDQYVTLKIYSEDALKELKGSLEKIIYSEK